MRISDWSSDVCSSDLSIARVRCPIRMAPRAGKAERRDMAATKTDDDSAPTQDRVIARLLTDDSVEWRIPPGSWLRSEERRGGTECVSTCRSRWQRCNEQKNQQQ